jgi:hypothetical protein
MEMISVSSTSLAAVGYDNETATLYVQFLNGSNFCYQGVPLDAYEGLLSAGSIGNHFHQFIKNGGYPYCKI